MRSYIDLDRWVEDHALPSCTSKHLHPHLAQSPQPKPLKRKRSILLEMSANSNARRTDIPTTPGKKKASTLLPPPSPEHEHEHGHGHDITPRASAIAAPLHLRYAPSFSAPAHTSPDPSSRSSTSASSSAASASSDTSRKRKRKASPQKDFAQRKFAQYAIWSRNIYEVLGPNSTLQDRTLAQNMLRISRGQGVFAPIDDTPHLRAALGYAEDGQLFAGMFESTRASLGETPSLADVRELLTKAERHQEFVASEAAWNSAVHHPILDLAARMSHCNNYTWDNVSTASIEPNSLLSNITEDEEPTGKKVDFCLSFTPQHHTLFRRARLPLNQTQYFPILCNPIAVSIETKISDAGAADGKRQLLTWVSAHVLRLRQLLDGNNGVDIPALPLILVQGHQWSFLCFKDHGGTPTATNTLDSGKPNATFYDRGFDIGGTDTVQGAYQIVAALQVLMRWMECVYRPWMEEVVLEPLADRLRNDGG